MRTCGIDLKGNDAIIVGLEGTKDTFKVLKSITKKVTFKDSNNQADVQEFHRTLLKILTDQNFDKIGIKGRATKGKFAGGSVSFKMEAITQLIPIPVQIISGPTLKAKLKSHLEEIEGNNVLSYQKEALKVARFLLEN